MTDRYFTTIFSFSRKFHRFFALQPYVHRALRALVSHTRFLRPCAPLFLVPSPLRALVPHVPCAFRVLVPQVPRVLRTLVSQVPRDLHALGPHFF